MRKWVLRMSYGLCFFAVMVVHAQTTPIPTTPIPSVSIPITLGSDNGVVTLPSGTPLPEVLIIAAAGFIVWGLRQGVGLFVDVRRARVKEDSAEAEQKRTLELEDSRTAMQVQTESSKQQTSLITAFSGLGTELHRTNSVIEQAFVGIAEDRQRSGDERGTILKVLETQGERYVGAQERGNTLMETLALAIKNVGVQSDLQSNRQASLEHMTGRVEKLLTEGETGTAKKLGGQMNGIDQRIERLEADTQRILLLLQQIAMKMGLEASPLDPEPLPIPPTEPTPASIE